jgi:hypothetical protein
VVRLISLCLARFVVVVVLLHCLMKIVGYNVFQSRTLSVGTDTTNLLKAQLLAVLCFDYLHP